MGRDGRAKEIQAESRLVLVTGALRMPVSRGGMLTLSLIEGVIR